MSAADTESVYLPPLQVVGTVLSVALATALYCKWRSSIALHANDCMDFMKWHSGWHYSLPLMASMAILTL